MKFFSLLVLVAATNLMAQSPVIETLAYSRSTIPGIPASNNTAMANNPLPAAYFLYIVVKKGTPVSLAGVCLNGREYAANLKRVSSPVLVEHDVSVPTGTNDKLVKATADDVYQVELEEQKDPVCKSRAKELGQQNEVVVCLKSGSSRWYGLAKTVVPLHPAAGM
jgi:hypothetical protein